MTQSSSAKSTGGIGSPAQAWARALERTAPIPRHPDRVFPTVIEECAAEFGDAPALLSERECLSYCELAARANRYARWALAQNIGKGDSVGLFLPNCPDFVAIWLGLTKIGAVVALLNTNLAGRSLAHCINVVSPKHLIVAAELIDRFTTALPQLAQPAAVWVRGGSPGAFRHLDREIEQYSDERLIPSEHRPLTIADRALYIYTSGTTGLPKAASVSHGRIMQWTHWFAGMLDTRPTDRLYDCLPMYHSVGGVQAPGAVLASGGSVVVAEKFSASRFWSETIRWDCTLFQYIGELCRYLVHAEPCPEETQHRLRMACGNGLRPDVWDQFKSRFRIPQILEFYAATEGNVSLFNVEGEPGAIGRIPKYLAHRFPAALVKFDVEKGEVVRDQRGFCIRCVPNEAGEAIGKVLNDSSNIGSRFEGYTSADASERRILHGVFEPGDTWFRTGDLMRKDERGFFYFVDRIGDTFRWKGENVATSEVAEALCAFAGIQQAMVYGVVIPDADGQAGMASLIADRELDLKALRSHLNTCLPHYARPLFIRLLNELPMTSTFKHSAVELRRQAYDPAATSDAIYFNHPEQEAFIRLDQALYERIQSGDVFRSRRSTVRSVAACEVAHA